MIVSGTPQATVSGGVVTLTGFLVDQIEADWTTTKRKRDPLNLRDGLLYAGDKALMAAWSDWVDYWAVDFDFNGVFRSFWQDFRLPKKQEIELVTPPHPTGNVIVVQVIDIFANEHRSMLNN